MAVNGPAREEMPVRLPPIAPAELTADQRPFYDEMQAGIAVSYHGVQTADQHGALVGPFNPWLYQPDIGRAIWALNRVLSAPSSIPDRPREIATLVVGGHFRATYEVESHRIFATRDGIPPASVDTIMAGHRPDTLTEEEACAYDFAAALCAGGVVPGPVYARTLRRFGPRTTSELVYLCGFYALACMTMNAYDVAGPEQP